MLLRKLNPDLISNQLLRNEMKAVLHLAELLPQNRLDLCKSTAGEISKVLLNQSSTTDLLFVCTHNARRSQFAQIWASYFLHTLQIPSFKACSAGTETTRVHPQVIQTIHEQGLHAVQESTGSNPVYQVFDNTQLLTSLYSKRIDDLTGFNERIAVMVCSHADEACPYVPASVARISLPFEDPGKFDNTEFEAARYLESSREIAASVLLILSSLNHTDA